MKWTLLFKFLFIQLFGGKYIVICYKYIFYCFIQNNELFKTMNQTKTKLFFFEALLLWLVVTLANNVTRGRCPQISLSLMHEDIASVVTSPMSLHRMSTSSGGFYILGLDLASARASATFLVGNFILLFKLRLMKIEQTVV